MQRVILSRTEITMMLVEHVCTLSHQQLFFAMRMFSCDLFVRDNAFKYNSDVELMLILNSSSQLGFSATYSKPLTTTVLKN